MKQVNRNIGKHMNKINLGRKKKGASDSEEEEKSEAEDSMAPEDQEVVKQARKEKKEKKGKAKRSYRFMGKHMNICTFCSKYKEVTVHM